MALDFSKPITTRDGRAVTIYCTDAPGDYPVHGRVEDSPPDTWTLDGQYYVENANDDPMDLINVLEPKRKWWVNVYIDNGIPRFSYPYKTRNSADNGADEEIPRIACIHFTEGQFDEA